MTDATFRSVLGMIYLQKVLLLVVFVSDTLFLSTISDRAVAGVGATIPLIYGFVAIVAVFASISTSKLARALGRDDRALAQSIFGASVALGVGLGATLMVCQLLVSGHFGRWIGLEGEAAQASKAYLAWMSPMLLLDGFFINFSAQINATRRPAAGVRAGIALIATSVLLNFVLYWELIPGLKLGPAEIAVATLLAQLPPLVIMALDISRSPVRLSPQWRWSESRGVIRGILRDGTPATLEPISVNLSQLTMVSLLAGVSASAVAALTYSRNMTLLFVFAGASAVGAATQVCVSHLHGRQDFRLADERLMRSLRMFIPALVALLAVFALMAQRLARLFTNDPQVIHFVTMIATVMVCGEPTRAVNLIVGPSLRGALDIRIPVGLSIASHWTIGIALAWALGVALGLGVPGILIGMYCDEAFRAAVNLWRWRSRRWTGNLIAEMEGRR